MGLCGEVDAVVEEAIPGASMAEQSGVPMVLPVGSRRNEAARKLDCWLSWWCQARWQDSQRRGG